LILTTKPLVKEIIFLILLSVILIC
jgi:hypothetical protein